MEIAFDKLIRLQQLDLEIFGLRASLEAVPARIEAVDREIEASAAIVARAKDSLAANQKRRRDLEGEVKVLREQASKFKRQLNDVKTNKEYSALLKEIEESDHKVAAIEEAILNEMIAADDVEREIKAAQKRQADEEGKLRADRESVYRDQKDLEARKTALEAERSILVPEIPADQLKLYTRIAKKTIGVALSRVTDDFCSICQLRVRPQMLDELMAMKEITTCEACGRILYYERSTEEGTGSGEASGPEAPDPNYRDDSNLPND